MIKPLISWNNIGVVEFGYCPQQHEACEFCKNNCKITRPKNDYYYVWQCSMFVMYDKFKGTAWEGGLSLIKL